MTPFQQVHMGSFLVSYASALRHNPKASCTALRYVDITAKDKCYLAYSKELGPVCGYVVRADGELCYVHSHERGRGDALVASAIASGAIKLDCFDGYLVKFYGNHGFKEVRREPNYTKGGPDVVWMERTE